MDFYITETALKLSRSLYCFTTTISHGVENYFPRLCSTGISDAIFVKLILKAPKTGYFVAKSFCKVSIFMTFIDI